MKSLEARKAERKERKEEAKAVAKEAGDILATGTMAEGMLGGVDADGDEAGEGEEGEGYESNTVAELKAELDNRGLEYASNAKKADLIAALEENDAE